jgi:hypothetical protein
MRLAKLLIAAGIAALSGGLAMVVAYSLTEAADWIIWASALALLGMIAGVSGLAATMRWQNQKLSRLIDRSYGARDDGGEPVTVDDLSELIRVVDARIVGMIETMRDDGPSHS